MKKNNPSTGTEAQRNQASNFTRQSGYSSGQFNPARRNGPQHNSPRRKRPRRNRVPVVVLVLVILVAAVLLLQPLLSGIFGGPAETTNSTTTSSAANPGNSTSSGSSTSKPTTAGTSTDKTTPSTAASTSGTTSATISAAARAEAFSTAKSEFEALVKTYKGRYALYYHNLINGETYAYNADQPFVAASSIKLGINTYLYTQIEAGIIDPDEMLAYDSRPYPTGDYEAGTGTIQGDANGTKYSVRNTSGLSIRISDNCGTNMVIRRLGGIDKINPYLNSISSVVDYRKSVSYKNWSGTSVSGRHRTSATDLGLHAVRLYELYEANPTIYGTLIDDLIKTEFDFGIQKGIPEDVKVAHKIGTNGTYNTENDVGIVFAGEPFVLAVMTESGSATNARQFQAKAAEIFYNYIKIIS
ncbi:MAG: serine hydrolase [Saccharofermentanales bacterium]|jgi:beta-lactamase class A